MTAGISSHFFHDDQVDQFTNDVSDLQDAIWYTERHRNEHGLDWLLSAAQTVVNGWVE